MVQTCIVNDPYAKYISIGLIKHQTKVCQPQVDHPIPQMRKVEQHIRKRKREGVRKLGGQKECVKTEGSECLSVVVIPRWKTDWEREGSSHIHNSKKFVCLFLRLMNTVV